MRAGEPVSPTFSTEYGGRCGWVVKETRRLIVEQSAPRLTNSVDVEDRVRNVTMLECDMNVVTRSREYCRTLSSPVETKGNVWL